MDLGGGWSSSVPMLSVSGALAVNGTTTVNLATSSLPTPGLYPLVDVSGKPAALADFSLGTISNPRIFASLVVNGQFLDLNVTGADSVIWTGARRHMGRQHDSQLEDVLHQPIDFVPAERRRIAGRHGDGHNEHQLDRGRNAVVAPDKQ